MVKKILKQTSTTIVFEFQHGQSNHLLNESNHAQFKTTVTQRFTPNWYCNLSFCTVFYDQIPSKFYTNDDKLVYKDF